MIVDETNPVTPEADSAMPESASLTRVAIRRHKNAAADGTETPKKARKQPDPTSAPGRGKTIKSGRKAAIVFDDTMPTASPVQFDPPVVSASGTAVANAAEVFEIAALPPSDPPLTVDSAISETPLPAMDEPPVMAEPAQSPEPEAAAPESPASELVALNFEFAVLPMPVDIDIEFLPDPEFCSYPEEAVPAESAPAVEPAVETAMPTHSPETEPASEPQWPSEATSEAELTAPAAHHSPSDFHREEEPAPADPVADTQPGTLESKPDTDAQSAQRSSASRFEAIARAARMSALSTSKPGIAKTIAVEAARSAEVQKRTTEIFGYWVRAKNGRRFPSRSDFEIAKVAEFWPNSMLLTCDGAPPAGGHHMSFSKVMRLDDGSDQSANEFNFTSMIIEWILTIGGEAARVGQPVQDTEVFPSSGGTHAYKIVALPLSDHQTQVDHVLCHLTRS